MKNVYEVLRQKEMELTRLEKEVEALRLVAPLLSEEKEINSDMVKPALATAVNGPQQPIRIPSPPVVAAAQPVRAAGWSRLFVAMIGRPTQAKPRAAPVVERELAGVTSRVMRQGEGWDFLHRVFLREGSEEDAVY